MKTLRRANASVGRSRQQLINNNNITKPTMQKYQSLPNLKIVIIIDQIQHHYY